MAEPKTKANIGSVDEFLSKVEPADKREDAKILLNLYKKITGEKPVLWGTEKSHFIGFGSYHFKSERSAQEGDWPLVAFSPRKANLTLYILEWKAEPPAELTKLGKYKMGGGCLYVNHLKDVDMAVLEAMIRNAYERMKKQHPG